MQWIFEHFGFFVFVIVAIAMGRALRKAMQMTREHEATTSESEEQKNLRRIRDEIRRKIAERRGGVAPAEPPPMVPVSPAPVARSLGPSPLPPLDPFGGPAKRMFAEVERRMQPRAPVAAPSPEPDHGAILARQEQLAEELRVLEEAQARAQRRAAEVVATRKAGRESETGRLVTARGTLLADLSEPQSLRRAFVLREVLGTPVGLR